MPLRRDWAEMEKTRAILRTDVARFLDRECSRELVARLEEDPLGYSPELWRSMAELGWLGVHIPEEYGGAGAGPEELAVVVELLGGAALPSPLFASIIEAGALIVLAGDDERRRQWLPALAQGELLMAVALQEPGPELDLAAIRTRAIPTAAGYRLWGRKLLVPYAELADKLICVARTGDEAGALGLFLVPRGAPGMQLTRLRTTNGDPQYVVDFQQVDLPYSSLLGEPGGAGPSLTGMLNEAAALKSAELVGIGQRALDLTLEFVKTRVQFDQPIAKFQAVQFHCADMYGQLEQARTLVAQALWRLANGKRATRDVSLAKVKASEGIPWLLRMAHQLHGGVGYDANYPLETLYRRSMAAQAAYGSAAWHRKRLATMLREQPASFRREGSHPFSGIPG